MLRGERKFLFSLLMVLTAHVPFLITKKSCFMTGQKISRLKYRKRWITLTELLPLVWTGMCKVRSQLDITASRQSLKDLVQSLKPCRQKINMKFNFMSVLRLYKLKLKSDVLSTDINMGDPANSKVSCEKYGRIGQLILLLFLPF